MSRLRGDKLTDADWRLWKKYRWNYWCGETTRFPARIQKRLVKCYSAEFALVHSGDVFFAMPARVIAAGGGTYEFTPSSPVEPSEPEK